MNKNSNSNKTEYNPSTIEQYWQKFWEENGTFSPDLRSAKKPFYDLMMFPYPSAEGLHVGNLYAFTGADVYGRYQRMKGFDVFEPIGLDGFGIHSENYALKVGRNPREQAEISQKKFYRQLRATGNGYDWTATLETYDSDYYRWTQWIFIQMFKKGLAYRKKAQVNWCPSDKTVLADEQVIDGKCERCSSLVEKRDLEQWFFKITEYADALLNGLTQIDWPEKIKIAQRQWIGRSEGVNIKHRVKDLGIEFEVYDSIPQTHRAQTFVVIAPEHPLISTLVQGTQYEKEVMAFVEKIVKKKSSKKFDIEREIEGVFTGRYSGNYLGTGVDLPIWVASFAIMEYGTGIIGCSAHDERDFKFAKKYHLPLKPVLFPQDQTLATKVRNLELFYREPDGILEEPVEFKGRRWDEVREAIIVYLEENGFGKRVSNYHLRDWLISRQRYWGPPIPIIYCRKCWESSEFRVQNSELKEGVDYAVIDGKEHMIHPVREEDLPVLLPDVADWRPQGSGTSPLANHPEFYETKCPNCGLKAKRETDVSDTFLDSAWYYLRYLTVRNQKIDADNVPYDIEIVKKWCPAAIYIGGAEHSVLHLLYVRFIAMVLHDLDNQLRLPFQEPFPRFFAHGLIVKDGAKMSKSRGNVVIPDEYIAKYGADTLRMYLMFLGPFDHGGDFRDTGLEGMSRFVRRVWILLTKQLTTDNLQPTTDRLRFMNKTIKAVTKDIEQFSYNTAIAKMMEYYNYLSKTKIPLSKIEIETFLKLLAPFAPHMTEELWQIMNQEARSMKQGKNKHDSIHFQEWPRYDEKYLTENQATIPIQVNGKRRGEIRVESGEMRNKKLIEELARKEVGKYLEGQVIHKVIYVPGKIINFVI